MSEALKAMKKASENNSTSKKVDKKPAKKKTASKKATPNPKLVKAAKSMELKKKASLSQIANKVMDKKEEPSMISESSLFPGTAVEQVGTIVNKQVDKNLQPGTVFVEPPKVSQGLGSYGHGYTASPQPVKRTETKEKPRTSYSTFGSIGSGFSGV